jgi:hypothetical protein
VSGADVLDTFRAACAAHGVPASALTDNGMVFTARLSGGRGGRNGLGHELRRLGIGQKNGKPNHPQTQGQAGRFQQTMKNRLRAQPHQPATFTGLQALLDAFAGTCGTRRPHRSLQDRATPASACAARPEAIPGDRTAGTRDRVRTDRIDNTGLVTLRRGGRLCHVGTGRPRAGTRVLLLVQDLHIRVINADTGELIREPILNPDKSCQPTGKPSGWPKKTPRPLRGFAVSSMSCDITQRADDGNRTRMTSLEVGSPSLRVGLRERRHWASARKCPSVTVADRRAPWRVARVWHASALFRTPPEHLSLGAGSYSYAVVQRGTERL